MTKLIDSLCVDVLHRESKIKDSSESYREIINKAYRDMNGVSYDDAYSVYGWWCPGFDVRALGKQWPNGDPKKSEIFFVPSSNLDVVAVPETVEDHPESMMIIVKSLADSLGVPYVELYPGYYYADSAAKTVDRIGSFEDVKSWVESLESYDDSEGLFNGKDPDKVWDYLKRWDRESVKDSLQDAKEKRSKVLAELKELRKSVSDDKIVEALAYYMSNADVVKFVDMVRKFHGVKPSVSDSYDDEYRQFDRFNDLREEVSDKEIVDVLPSYMGGFEINKFVDKVRNFYGLAQNPDEDTEDSARQGITDSVTKFKVSPKDAEAVRKSFEEAGTPLKESNAWFYAEAPKERVVELLKDYEYEIEDSASKVSDAAYNPKFEKLRKVLSDTTIVEELSHYMSSDELEEFTETLTRNYDIDLEEVEDSAK